MASRQKGAHAETETLAAMEAAGAFFSLDKEYKLTIDNAKSAAFRGYIAQGLENTNGVVDEREQIEFGVESAFPKPKPCRDAH